MSFINQTDKTNFIRLRIRDILVPKADVERELYDKKKKEILPFTYFSKKQFDDFVELSEEKEDPVTIKVLGNVKIYKKKYKDIKENQSFDDFVEEKRDKDIYGCVQVRYSKSYIEKHKDELNGEVYKKYDLYEAKKHRCYGYAEVGENEYVRLVKRNPLIIILILFLCVGLLVGSAVLLKDDLPDLLDIDSTIDYDGEKNRGDDQQEIQESYEIPYVPSVKLTSAEPDLYLINPEGNTVYFMYTLYIDKDGSGAIEKDEAVDANGKSKAFYQTKLIPPGQMIAADIHSVLPKGEYNVIQKISAYNYAPGTKEDQAPCNGSNLLTKIIIA